MSANDYYSRDARRAFDPPKLIYTFQNKLLASTTEEGWLKLIYLIGDKINLSLANHRLF